MNFLLERVIGQGHKTKQRDKQASLFGNIVKLQNGASRNLIACGLVNAFYLITGNNS